MRTRGAPFHISLSASKRVKVDTHRQCLTQVVARLILVRWVDVPTARFVAIHTDKVPLPHIVREIVLRHITPVWKLERLILNFRSAGVKSKVWELLIFVGVEARRKAIRVETPQRPEDGQIRKRFVDKVLVGTFQV